MSGLNVLVLSLSKGFADDWQSVLVNVGASVTKRIRPAPLLRDPDVIVTDSRAPRELCEVLRNRTFSPCHKCPNVLCFSLKVCPSVRILSSRFYTK